MFKGDLILAGLDRGLGGIDQVVPVVRRGEDKGRHRHGDQSEKARPATRMVRGADIFEDEKRPRDRNQSMTQPRQLRLLHLAGVTGHCGFGSDHHQGPDHPDKG